MIIIVFELALYILSATFATLFAQTHTPIIVGGSESTNLAYIFLEIQRAMHRDCLQAQENGDEEEKATRKMHNGDVLCTIVEMASGVPVGRGVRMFWC